MSQTAQEALTSYIAPAPVAAEEITSVDTYSTDDQINSFLFGQRPEPYIPPLPERAPEPKSVVLSPKPLADAIIAEASRQRTANEAWGMPTPRFAIVGGQSYGENRGQLLDTVADYVKTDTMPAPFGDTTDYIFYSLLRQAGAAGIQPVIHVAEEVRDDPAIRKIVAGMGFNPDEIFAQNDLGGVVQDLARPVKKRARILARCEEFTAERQALLDRQGLEGTHNAQITDRLAYLDESLQALADHLGEVEAIIDLRLAQEDEKIAAIVARENENQRVAALVAAVPSYTEAGRKKIIGEITDPLKDVDGLSEHSHWGQVTPEAMWRCAQFFAHRKILGKFVVQIGNGRIGRDLAALTNPSRVLDGVQQTSQWLARPNQRVGVLTTAIPAAETVRVDQLRASAWTKWGDRFFGWMMRRRLLIVDSGVATVINENTGKRETRGNVDMSTVPKDGTVEVVRPGQVTGAIAAKRVIDAAILRFRQTWTQDVDLPVAANNGASPNDGRASGWPGLINA